MSEQHTLVILRHAKSAWPEGVPDIDRPLARRGRSDAVAAGRWLQDHLGGIDLVVCSPAVRARQTCELALHELHRVARLHHDDKLYAASAEELLAVVRDLPDKARTVLFIAHNPGMADLVALLTGSTHELKTSGIAVLTSPKSWAAAKPRSATLAEHATPRGDN